MDMARPASENSRESGANVSNVFEVSAAELMSRQVPENLQDRTEMGANAEAMRAQGEKTSAATLEKMPEVEASKNEDSIEAEARGIKEIHVPRNAEVLPKEYMDWVERLIRENKENPGKLVELLDKSRWNYMQDAFGRKRGDGK